MGRRVAPRSGGGGRRTQGRAPARGAQRPNGNPRLTRGNGTPGPGRGGPGTAKYTGHRHGNLGPTHISGAGWHQHETLVENPPHSSDSGHIHESSMAGSPSHSHKSQTYGHSGSMGAHQGGWPSPPNYIEGATNTGSYHIHSPASGPGTHLHQRGPRPPQPRSGTGSGRRTMGSRNLRSRRR